MWGAMKMVKLLQSKQFLAASTGFAKRLALTFVCAGSFSWAANAAIVDGRFCTNQTFDIQYNYNPPGTLNASSFVVPYDSGFQSSPLTAGQSYGFFASTTVPGTYGLAIYDSNNQVVRIMHQTGSFSAMGPDFLFYVGSGFYGTLISTTQGFALGGSATFPGVVLAPSASDIANFAWPSLVCLGDGETASPTRSVNAINTLVTLQSLAQIVRNQLLLREASIVSVLGYDSNEFGKHNISLSFAGRYSSLGDSTQGGSGALIAAFKVHPNVRIGAFIDYAVAQNSQRGISYSDTLPTFGAFAVYEANEDLTGFSARIAAAYNASRMTITRDASLTNTEAGSGKSRLTSFGVAAEAGYGVRISPTFVAVPYLSIRYTDATRHGYSEAETNDVTKPVTYNDYSQKLTTALTGVRLHGKFGEDVTLFVGLGAEYDLDRQMDAFTGTSAISGLPTFSIATNSHPNRLRASASAGLRYRLAGNQSVSANVAVRQQAYSADPSVTFMVKYSVGF